MYSLRKDGTQILPVVRVLVQHQSLLRFGEVFDVGGFVPEPELGLHRGEQPARCRRRHRCMCRSPRAATFRSLSLYFFISRRAFSSAPRTDEGNTWRNSAASKASSASSASDASSPSAAAPVAGTAAPKPSALSESDAPTSGRPRSGAAPAVRGARDAALPALLHDDGGRLEQRRAHRPPGRGRVPAPRPHARAEVHVGDEEIAADALRALSDAPSSDSSAAPPPDAVSPTAQLRHEAASDGRRQPPPQPPDPAPHTLPRRRHALARRRERGRGVRVQARRVDEAALHLEEPRGLCTCARNAASA